MKTTQILSLLSLSAASLAAPIDARDAKGGSSSAPVAAPAPASGGAKTAAVVGGLTGSSALVFLQSLFSRDLESRDVPPVIFLSEEGDIVKRDAKGGLPIPVKPAGAGGPALTPAPSSGGQKTAAVIGGLTGSSALVGLQQLFSRDAEAQDAIPVIFLSEEEKRDIVARDADAQDVIPVIFFSEEEKRDIEARDADAQDAIPVIFLTEEEKRDLEAREAKGGQIRAGVIGGVTSASSLVGLRLALGIPATGPPSN